MLTCETELGAGAYAFAESDGVENAHVQWASDEPDRRTPALELALLDRPQLTPRVRNGRLRECNLRRGKLGVGDVAFLKVQINFYLGEMFRPLGLDQIFPTMQGIELRKLTK